jgi:hypothetical protein
VPKDLPVVVSDGREYFQLWHYAPVSLGRRLWALIDIPAAIAHVGNDTVERNLLAADTIVPLQIQGYSQFSATTS